jgi:DNA polymerase I/DNA polymerase-2
MRVDLAVLDADYEIREGKPVVQLYCADSDGNAALVTDKSFSPYFYMIPKKDAKKTAKEILKADTGGEFKITSTEVAKVTWMGKETEVVKIFVDIPGNVPKAKSSMKYLGVDYIDTFEFDIPFYKRYLVDKSISPTELMEFELNEEGEVLSVSKPKSSSEPDFHVLAFDTEFVDEDGESRLIMLSMCDNRGMRKVLTSHAWDGMQDFVEVADGEKGILERFLQVVFETNPDLICGYNSDNFDFPKMKERAEKNGVSFRIGRSGEDVRFVRRGIDTSAKIKGRPHIDLYQFVNHILRPSMRSEVLTLNEVAKELLGEGKRDMKYKDMLNIWSTKNGMDKLAEYSMVDSEITLKLAKLLLPQIYALCRITGQLPFDVCRYLYSQLVESFYMRKAFEDGVLMPNRPMSEELEERRMLPQYKGAIVIEPKKGIHSNVMIFDFRSLYPTIIVTHNIDPFTFMCPHADCAKENKVPESDFHFCKKEKGFIPKHLEEIISRRKSIKDAMKKAEKGSPEYMSMDNSQFALKTITNATYGSLAYAAARWYKRECGAATTSFGRFYITKVVGVAEKSGFQVIYGDTDSMMATYQKEKSREKLRTVAEGFAEKINKNLPGIIELEFRDLYEGGIFVSKGKGENEVGAKKRYALIDYDGKLEVRGFETVRRDWCDLAKKIQRDVLMIILKEKDPVKAVKAVRKVVEKINSGKAKLEELTIYEMLTRPLSAYKQIGPHVKAAMKAKERGAKVGEGSIIPFVITKGSGSISDRAEIVDNVKPGAYDPEYYVNNQILPASMRVLKALGYEEGEVLSGKVQKKLEGFFKKK